jgi:hypothetical protein
MKTCEPHIPNPHVILQPKIPTRLGNGIGRILGDGRFNGELQFIASSSLNGSSSPMELWIQQNISIEGDRHPISDLHFKRSINEDDLIDLMVQSQ